MQGFARATSYIPTEVAFTTTGNIDNLDFSGADLIRMNNATDATIRGLVAGSPGQQVTIVSIGAGHVYLAHQNANSTEANRLINYATGAATPLGARAGTATYQYDATTDRWRLVAHEQGAWITPTFAAGDYTATSGTWTVESADVSTFTHRLVGRTMNVIWNIGTFSVSANPSSLLRVIPGGFTSTGNQPGTCMVADNGETRELGVWVALGTSMYFQLGDNTAWAITTNGGGTFGSAAFQIV